MFKIKKLLNIFKNNEVKKILLYSYIISQNQNKNLSDQIFQQLLYLKEIYPNLTIEINYTNNEASKFIPQTNTIVLNGIFDSTTFFHEITHLFSYHYNQFNVPKEFYNLKKNIISSNEKNSLIIPFMELCKKEKNKILKNYLKQNNNNNNNNNNNKEYLNEKNDYLIITKIEDIIDALYSGKASTQGLKYLKDDNTIPIKSSKSAGHGCEYYKKTNYEFEEIIANYQAIKLTDPNNQLFILLQQILGTKFITFLDNECQKINNIYTINIKKNNINNK